MGKNLGAFVIPYLPQRRIHRVKRLSAMVLIFIFSSAIPVLAQTANATISGTVLDPMNAVVAKAGITALNVRTGVMTTTMTNDSGVYVLSSIQPGLYRLTAEAAGFQTYVLNDVNVEVGAHININFSLVLAGAAAAIEVTALPDSLLSTTASVGGVINDQRVQNLPLPDRDALGLVLTQPGLVGDNFGGSRSGALNVTRDGINVMDQRINSGVNSVVLPSVDVVEEVRVITSPADAELGRGSGQVQILTRSGTNEYHGSLFEFHRNTVLNANGWFNNLRGEPRDALILNQFGGRLGGPVTRDRSFFHFTYEGIRQRTADTVTALTYTELARQGRFRFFPGVQNGNANAAVPTVDLSGNPVKPAGATEDLQTANIFGLDPNRLGFDRTGTIRRLLDVMPAPNDFRYGDGLNVAGYTWRSRTTADLNQYNGKFDYHFNNRHRASVGYTRETLESLNGYMPRPFPRSPAGSLTAKATFYSINVSSTLSATKLNEFHMGAQRPRIRFNAPWELPGGRELMPTANGYGYLPVFRLAAGPIPTDNDPQARVSPLYAFGDTFHLQRGKHAVKFGGELRFASTNGFNAFNVTPRVVFGIGDGPDVVGVNSFVIPGLGANEGTAQSLLMDLSGSVDSVLQAFNASGGPTPTFLVGETKQRTWRQREFSFFLQDDFKLRAAVTLNLGMRYEYYGVPWDAHGRTAAPLGGSTGLFGISGRSWADMYRPGMYKGDYTQVQLIGRGSPNPNTNLYDDDWNNFGPVVGLSWSIPYFGKDKTVLRAGYSLTYEREALRLVDIVAGDEPGLRTETLFTSNSYLDLSQIRLPLVPDIEPLDIVPLTDRTQVIRSFDNNLRTPYVQNWNLSIQRALPAKFILDVRYVGSKGTKLLRTVNINETNIFENGLLDAFLTTQTGGNAAIFDRMFRGLNLGLGAVNGTTITGSASLRAFATTRSALANNSIGDFATYLNQAALFGQRGGLLRFSALPENWIVVNPQFGAAYFTGNFSNSTYHSLQINAERRLSNGLTWQSNYTWSRALGDEEGDSQDILNSYRNGRNRRIDKRLLGFHRTHVVRNNATWELPFGPDRKFLSGTHGALAQVLRGWQLGAIYNVFSGAPIGLSATVSSLNQFLDNTPTLVGSLPKSTGTVKRLNDGVTYFGNLKQVPDPAIASLTGQQLLNTRSTMKAITDSAGNIIAVNPTPGTLGSLSQTSLQGPGAFRLDVNLIKSFSLREGRELQFRVDAINLLNSPQFGSPETDINSTNFGRITSAAGARLIALSARINF
jgi:Carboxypeptidase regulatory-like domain